MVPDLEQNKKQNYSKFFWLDLEIILNEFDFIII